MKLVAIGRLRDGADVHDIGRYARQEMAAAGPHEAEAAVARLPLAAADLIVFEVIELHPFSALQVLFAGRQPLVTTEGQGPA